MTERTVEEIKKELTETQTKATNVAKEYTSIASPLNIKVRALYNELRKAEEAQRNNVAGRQESVARVAEITEEVKKLLSESEELCNKYNLTFSIFTDNMDNSLRYSEYGYTGWESSSC